MRAAALAPWGLVCGALLAGCGSSSSTPSTGDTSGAETTTLRSEGSARSDGEPTASAQPEDAHAAGRVGTHATITTQPGTSPSGGRSADLADYAARTMAIVRRHWTIPAALSPEGASLLSSTISISIDETTRRASGYRIVTESGNAVFDESVRRGLQALVDANELMPEPPVGLDDRASVRLRLTGR